MNESKPISCYMFKDVTVCVGYTNNKYTSCDFQKLSGSWDTPTPEQVRADIETAFENDPGIRSIIPGHRAILVPRRPKIKIEYRGASDQFSIPLISLRVTFVLSGAQGIIYVSPDALPHKYGME